ncbi:MAG: flagellar hook assembly protein FlgD [Phycisphaerae bacterium]
MSTINTNALNSATVANSKNSSNNGLNALSSADFMKLMITQLSNQDPLNPTDSNQMLGQISQISTLQSNTQMTQSLSTLTLQQSIGAGGNLVGKTVTGVDTDGNDVTGVVNGVKVMSNKVYLAVTDANGNTSPVSMENLSQISNATSDASLVQQGMQTLAAQQSLGNASTLIGKSITAAGTGNTTISGNVTGVQLLNGVVNLKLDNGQTVPAANVTSYGNPMQTAVGTLGA